MSENQIETTIRSFTYTNESNRQTVAKKIQDKVSPIPTASRRDASFELGEVIMEKFARAANR